MKFLPQTLFLLLLAVSPLLEAKPWKGAEVNTHKILSTEPLRPGFKLLRDQG